VKSMALHLLFFCSGLSGLLYQVVWVRQFGHVYGNTIHSASMVVAIFMLGLGAGGYLLGTWADRRYQSRPDSLVRAYAVLETLIAGWGLLISLLLPYLAAVVARLSSYGTGPVGWHELTMVSYLSRAAIAVGLLAPMTVLMGGTFTVLVRAQVRSDLGSSGWRIALLYGTNTLGAASGAFLTDFVLIPQLGLLVTQFVAVALNLVAAAGSFGLPRSRRISRVQLPSCPSRSGGARRNLQEASSGRVGRSRSVLRRRAPRPNLQPSSIDKRNVSGRLARLAGWLLPSRCPGSLRSAWRCSGCDILPCCSVGFELSSRCC